MTFYLSYTLRLVFFLLILAAGAAAQSTFERGMQLYKEGKLDAAISTLQAATQEKDGSENANVWNFLGLAYYAKGDMKGAKSAFERAVKIDAGSAAFHGNLASVYLNLAKGRDARKEAEASLRIDPKNTNAMFILGRLSVWDDRLDDAERYSGQIIALRPDSPDGYILRSNALMARLGNSVASGWDVKDELELLKETADVLKTGVDKSRKDPANPFIMQQAEAVAAFYDYFARDRSTPKPKADGEVVVPLKIISKSPASYTPEARAARIQGKIRIAVLFGAGGYVNYTLLIKGLGYGLDEVAAQAARSIRFTPQMVAGKPVSTVKLVEYTFSVF